MSKPNVLISIPTRDWIHSGTMVYVLREQQEIAHHDVGVHVLSSSLPLELQRNNQILYFLTELTPYTHLFLLDSDNIPEPGTITKLLDYDKDAVHSVGATVICGAHVFTASWKNPSGNPYEQYSMPGVDHPDSHGLKQIDGCGASGLLIKRHVIQALEYPYFKMIYSEGKLELGEDFYFCNKIKEAGFELWADFDLRMQHMCLIPV
jgi:hypothetical protein